ncbi:MAG: hypothetical protein ACR2NM_10550 [Bythopirellula sp.]
MSVITTRHSNSRCVITGCCLLLFFASGASTLSADWREDIGYNKLADVLGDSLPDGSGVSFSLVEAQQGPNGPYFPDTANSLFGAETDPLGSAVSFTDGSGGQNKGTSSHSNSQAQVIIGNTSSVAPAANQVTVYEANHYLNSVLNVNSGGNTNPPRAQDFRVQNFSWIGTFVDATDGDPVPTTAELNLDRESLRRFDYVIDTNNVTALVGLNNNLAAIPHLLAHSYNSIAVGRSDGNHSSGLTHLSDYGPGRSKPDIVSPRPTSSSATSTASSSAIFLHSSATVLGTDAAESQTMKAILMAGASKEPFPTWSQIDAGSVWHPLDDTYGAGELSLYDSYLITLGGQAVGTTTTPTPVASHGWDFQNVQPGTGNELLYDFVIPGGSTAEELSIVLAWNAEFLSPPIDFNSADPTVADLNLEIVDSTGMTVDFDINDSIVEGLSDSDVDNVEHLYLADLAAGTYTLKVSSDDLASDFGLAWRTTTRFDSVSADFDEDGDTDGADFLAWQLGNGTLLGAVHADGDADGDGDVDEDDLAIFDSEVMGTTMSLLSSSIAAIPEPGSWVLLVAGGCLALGLRTLPYPSRHQ